jgi:hypothetical protein
MTRVFGNLRSADFDWLDGLLEWPWVGGSWRLMDFWLSIAVLQAFSGCSEFHAEVEEPFEVVAGAN